MHIEPSWERLLVLLEEGALWRSLFVLGNAGSGKTTLCRFLGTSLASRFRTAAVDGDPGQSTLGLPTTVSLAWEPWAGQEPFALRFVGATTPVGHFLQTMAGIRRLGDRAVEEGAQKVVFDSSGYVATDAGREFHHLTIDLIDPDHLVVLQQNDELEPLLAGFGRRVRPRIHRLNMSGAVVERSRSERRSHRQHKFARYFAAASTRELSLEDRGFHGRIPSFDDPLDYRNRLVALCDRRGFVVVLGLVEHIDRTQRRMTVFSPDFDPDEVASLQLGALQLDRSGRELDAPSGSSSGVR